MKNIVVVGAGPAGLSAAIFARRAGASVALVERNPQCGAKLLATGGGHCNAANLRPLDEWPALFGKRGRFITPALAFLPREKLEDWFSALGEPLQTQDGFHLFPRSRSARNVRDALRAEAESLGVEIILDARCADILAENGTATGVALEGGGGMSGAVILATGGNSYAAIGSDWSGCRMAEQLGHAVTPPTPGLVGLRTRSIDSGLAGVILPAARVIFKVKGRKEESGTGELLITHSGISGPAVLDLSATVCQNAPAIITIRWSAEMNANAWHTFFEQTRQTNGKTPIATVLRNHLPQRLAKWICAQANTEPETSAANIKAESRDRLVTLLADFPAEITASEGWDKAMITRGGIDLRQINPETLESRLVRDLYFAGEMIDVDGPCGGYNLHWAFASGALAGESATHLAFFPATENNPRLARIKTPPSTAPMSGH